MSYKAFADVLRSTAPAVGTILSTSSTEVAEVIAACGFDWLFLDLEHGAIDVGEAQHVLQAVGDKAPVAIRVPEASDLWIKRCLDLGCNAVIVPLVNTAGDARRAVAASKYPPVGARSVGIARAHAYGSDFAGYVEAANRATSVIVQIEHIEGVKNVHEILSVEGIDGLFVGPYDLSGSMNVLGDVSHSDVRAAIESVKLACQEVGMPVGIFTMTAEAAKDALNSGYSFVAVGIDLSLLAASARSVLDALAQR